MFYQWKPYVTAAERRAKAERAAARLRKKGKALSPVPASRGAIARTFWGKAWCDNLERYSDFANRLPRGRTYLRNGSVIDLAIGAGAASAQVMGSSLYKVTVNISGVPKAQWQAIGKDCAGSIDSMIELLQGRLSTGVMERLCRPGTGLFPAPKEIEFACTCPDWAGMCKHVAAAFYGIGARLDAQPDLLFTLRRVDAKELVARVGEGLPRGNKRPTGGKELKVPELAEMFGIEMAQVEAQVAESPAKRRRRALAKPASVRKGTPAPKKKTRGRGAVSTARTRNRRQK